MSGSVKCLKASWSAAGLRKPRGLVQRKTLRFPVHEAESGPKVEKKSRGYPVPILRNAVDSPGVQKLHNAVRIAFGFPGDEFRHFG
jgi:hypothetical protein